MDFNQIADTLIQISRALEAAGYDEESFQAYQTWRALITRAAGQDPQAQGILVLSLHVWEAALRMKKEQEIA